MKLRTILRRTSLVVAACCIGGGTVWLMDMPMKVKRISVHGARLVAPADVKKIAGAELDSSVAPAEIRRMEASLERHPAFEAASVSRGLTGTLHVRVRERVPVAWMRGYRCAVAEDGILLPHVRQRDSAWICLDGVAVDSGKTGNISAIREALEGRQLGRDVDVSGGGVWRKLSEVNWEWETGGKRIQMTSPIREDEFKRLDRFRRAYPKAWDGARVLDLRFADRVVVKR